MDPSILHWLNEAEWIWARTYADKAPHWYVLKSNSPWLHSQMAEIIAQHGMDRPFESQTYRYLDVGDYEYWVMGDVLNRALRL